MGRAGKAHYDTASYTKIDVSTRCGRLYINRVMRQLSSCDAHPLVATCSPNLAHIPDSAIDVYLCVNDNIAIVDLSPAPETDTKTALITKSYSLLPPSSDPPSSGRAGPTNLPGVF